jgi:hypothetical protein
MNNSHANNSFLLPRSKQSKVLRKKQIAYTSVLAAVVVNIYGRRFSRLILTVFNNAKLAVHPPSKGFYRV